MYVFNSILFHFSNWAGTDRLPVNQKLLVYLGVFILTIKEEIGSFVMTNDAPKAVSDRSTAPCHSVRNPWTCDGKMPRNYNLL